MRGVIWLAAAGTLAIAAPATATSSEANIRCFLVSNFFAKGAKDAKRQQIAAFVRFYNLGQMQAKLSPVQIRSQISNVAKTINAQVAANTMNACAASLEAADRSIEAIGQQLQGNAVR